MPSGKTLCIFWDLSQHTATSQHSDGFRCGDVAMIMAVEFFHPLIPSFLPSFIHDPHPVRLETMQGSGSAAIRKLFSGRFPGHHLRIVCSGYGGNSIFAKLWREMLSLSQHLFWMLGDKRTSQPSTITQNKSSHWEKHRLFFMAPERQQRPLAAGLLLWSGGYWDLWLPRQVRERVIVWQAVFSHHP